MEREGSPLAINSPEGRAMPLIPRVLVTELCSRRI